MIETFLLKLFRVKIYLWLVVLFIAAYIALMLMNKYSEPSIAETQSYSMVKYLEETQEQVFLNVGIQDVETQTNNTKIPWTKIGIPLTEKKAIIILNYQAKLGIKKPIDIEHEEDGKYKITIPQYEVIGVALDEENPYQLFNKSGELLSSSTEEIDTGKLVTETLSNERQKHYLDQYKDFLNESAKNYYESLFDSIDSEIELTFVFPDQ